jgi:hypothetical protein
LPTDISPSNYSARSASCARDARDEIDRLIRFLDETDNHMELEPEAEGDDCELEDGANEEPSLGSHEVREAGPVSYFARAVYAAGEMILDCEGDEHDGREPGDSGIGDHDGLLEQVGWRDWQHAGMA